MVIGFTGTQAGLSDAQRETLLDTLTHSEVDTVVHGDCVGADAQFHAVVRELFGSSVCIVALPADLPGKRAYCDADEVGDAAPPLVRNRQIASMCDLLIACPKEASEVLRSGTWATVRYAMSERKTIVIILPDGDTLLMVCGYAEEGSGDIARNARWN